MRGEGNLENVSHLKENQFQKNHTINIQQKRKYFFYKRLIDIIGALSGLILLLPLFIIVAVWIKMDDPKGGVFFKQVRIGKNEETFEMFKFRSMCVDAETKLNELLGKNEVEGAMFKMKNDPRITNVGRFIRKTSIDELPQLWNVLKGDMSLVGPRPPLPREVEEYTSHHKKRLKITPGCTGLWQVSGRNNVSFEDMVELDIKYISNVSFSSDLKILIKTIAVLFGDENAY